MSEINAPVKKITYGEVKMGMRLKFPVKKVDGSWKTKILFVKKVETYEGEVVVYMSEGYTLKRSLEKTVLMVTDPAN